MHTKKTIFTPFCLNSTTCFSTHLPAFYRKRVAQERKPYKRQQGRGQLSLYCYKTLRTNRRIISYILLYLIYNSSVLYQGKRLKDKGLYPSKPCCCPNYTKRLALTANMQETGLGQQHLSPTSILSRCNEALFLFEETN